MISNNSRQGRPGIPRSDEHKEALSESLKRYFNELKEAGLIHPKLGSHHSPASIKQMSLSHMGHKSWNKGLIIEGPLVKQAKRTGSSIIVRLPKQWRDKIVKCSSAGNIVVKKVIRGGNSGLVCVPKTWVGMEVEVNVIEDTEGKPRSKELEQKPDLPVTKTLCCKICEYTFTITTNDEFIKCPSCNRKINAIEDRYGVESFQSSLKTANRVNDMVMLTPHEPHTGRPGSKETRKVIEGPIIKVATRKNVIILPIEWLGKVVRCSAVINGNTVVKEAKHNGHSSYVSVPKTWVGMQVEANVVEDITGIILTPHESRGKHFSLEHKEALRESLKRHFNYLKEAGLLHPRLGTRGMRHSEESKAKMSESHKGHTAWNKGLRVSGVV